MLSDDSATQLLPETDFAELAAKFASSTGPGLSADLSAELALEIVLHEIVEHACLATGATGAAIVLERDGEMVCRASSGPTAPHLGARLDAGSGLSGECIRTRQIQHCDDAQADPRADAEASRRLGVRSVAVFPLSHAGRMLGIFEALSSRPSLFGEREMRMLEAFAGRVLKNLECAAQPFVPCAGATSPGGSRDVAPPECAGVPLAPVSRRGADIVTWVLGAIVLICAGWLGLRAFQHLRVAQAPQARTTFGAGKTNKPQGRDAALSGQGGVASASVPSPAAHKGAPEISKAAHANQSPVPEGTLLVYENGREVFRMPPGQTDHPDLAQANRLQRASSLQLQQALELSPTADEGSLLRRVEPQYPVEAMQQRIQGTVVLEVRIDPEGRIQGIRVVSGQPILADAAMAAVKLWRFKPQIVSGRPAEMQTTITLNFRLPG